MLASTLMQLSQAPNAKTVQVISVQFLSGGQAQRLAVARVLASGRKVLVLDEPSVGLDPLRVIELARVLRTLCDEQAASVITVTHDPTFAALFADRVLLLEAGALRSITIDARLWPGCREADARDRVRATLEATLLNQFAPSPTRAKRWIRAAFSRILGSAGGLLRPMEVLGAAPWLAVRQAFRAPKDFATVFARTTLQGFIRPLLFYVIVAFLLGLTTLYVMSTVSGHLGSTFVIMSIKGKYIVALAPPLLGFLFTAASANAVNAWLGGMRLTKQITALEALGVSRKNYLWGPAWLGLTISFLLSGVGFVGGLYLGGLALCEHLGIPNAAELLAQDLVDPDANGAPYRVRAIALMLIYAAGISADAIARADGPKNTSDEVTRAMTRSVVASTLWIAAWELASLVLLTTLKGPQ